MAPHSDDLELEQVMKRKEKKGTTEMHTLLAQQRLERGIEPAGLDAIRKALRGATLFAVGVRRGVTNGA